MSKQFLPYHADDVSALARSLGRQLEAHQASSARLPSHVTLLNMLARAAGHRNFQSYKSGTPAAPSLPANAALPDPPSAGLPADADRLLRVLDDRGRLLRWPGKRGVQQLAIWYLWTLFEAKRIYTEREVTSLLAAHNDFDDPVILRRELINEKLLVRTPDGREYRKQPRRASGEVAALLKVIRARLKAGRDARSLAAAEARVRARRTAA